jgi:hypothetical protein
MALSDVLHELNDPIMSELKGGPGCWIAQATLASR